VKITVRMALGIFFLGIFSASLLMILGFVLWNHGGPRWIVLSALLSVVGLIISGIAAIFDTNWGLCKRCYT